MKVKKQGVTLNDHMVQPRNMIFYIVAINVCY